MPREEIIYEKADGVHFGSEIEKYFVKTEAKLATIGTSDKAQVAAIIGDGSGLRVKIRLPGDDWTEV